MLWFRAGIYLYVRAKNPQPGMRKSPLAHRGRLLPKSARYLAGAALITSDIVIKRVRSDGVNRHVALGWTGCSPCPPCSGLTPVATKSHVF
mgnify:CR=1 FL=1